jgi:hypothetical protein
VAAFHEGDFTYCHRGYPDMPLMSQTGHLIVEFFRRAVPRPNIGAQLFQLMREAGFQAPVCRAECVMDGGPHSPMYEWFAETIRSLLPRMEAIGITTASEVAVDTLADRLRAEALETGGAAFSPLLIGAFARRPHAS